MRQNFYKTGFGPHGVNLLDKYPPTYFGRFVEYFLGYDVWEENRWNLDTMTYFAHGVDQCLWTITTVLREVR